MTTVELARISDQARQIEFRRAFLTALASMLYAVGWITRKVFVVLWLALTWSWVAVRAGWRDAAPTPRTKR
jgi:hypothetical protein